MEIGIIGGGSIGLLFGHYLNLNNQVTIYCRSIEQVQQINEQGLALETSNGTVTAQISVNLSEEMHQEDLFIITVKQYHLPGLKSVLNRIPNDTPLIFLQNGMGHLSYLDELPHENILVGVVEHGALKISGNEVIQTGKGKTRLAIYRGGKATLNKVIGSLHQKDFPFEAESDYITMLQRKLVVNAVINPLTGVLNVHNGELIYNQHYYQLLKQVFNEIRVILDLSNPEQYFKEVVSICQKTAANTSSLLKDIIEKRQTEIEGILGYILEIGREKNQPAHSLRFLYHAIKAKEPKKG